ncbi:hypothetical protein DV711_05195 [Motiliproteus coralliicola]|uniref:Uncharacterized protein n=1 Tax=Motiliproteus coralliicola TaxID=2283196 RepID=A0A369WS90_9GAMM|nr:hypothetical protein [Motiliproteus coralliicola]RDE24970.1 hypothetical protein DV711_05195 [Motiliproteus coralliicola]
MFIKIKKNCGILMENNAMDQGIVVPVSSNFLINLNQVAEISFYTLKESKKRQNIDHAELVIPTNTRVIHLTMDYRYESHQEDRPGVFNRQVNQRAYYKLFFLPECPGQYEELRGYIEQQVLNL